jgi:hypothetical protein
VPHDRHGPEDAGAACRPARRDLGIIIAPGYAAELHIHNGPVVGSTEAGSAVYQIEGGPETVLKPGDVCSEPEAGASRASTRRTMA